MSKKKAAVAVLAAASIVAAALPSEDIQSVLTRSSVYKKLSSGEYQTSDGVLIRIIKTPTGWVISELRIELAPGAPHGVRTLICDPQNIRSITDSLKQIRAIKQAFLENDIDVKNLGSGEVRLNFVNTPHKGWICIGKTTT